MLFKSLRSRLLDAVNREDWKKLERLCTKHRAKIHEECKDWRTAPKNLLQNHAAGLQYLKNITLLAQYLDEVFGESGLLDALVGTPETNRLTKWEQKLEATHQLMDEQRYDEAEPLLREMLSEFERYIGEGVDLNLPVALVQLGRCLFETGRVHEAKTPLIQALEISASKNYGDRAAACLRWLAEVHRYLGETQLAADYLDCLVDVLEAGVEGEDPSVVRARAGRIREGEPLNRVVIVIGDKQMELEETHGLNLSNTRVHLIFERNRMSLDECTKLTTIGIAHREDRKFHESLTAFRKAMKVDPFDPNPHYQAGVTLLYLTRYEEAREAFQVTESLGPGWFHCREFEWLAGELAAGRITHDMFLTFRRLEEDLSSEQMAAIAEEALTLRPDLAALWLCYGDSLVEQGRREEAVNLYRRGLDCVAEPDVETRLLVKLAMASESGPERTRIFERAAELQGNVLASALARLTLASASGGARGS